MVFLALFDIWAENRIFLPRIGFQKKFLKCLKACLVGVFWVFQSIFIIVRLLGPEPDIWAENRIFKKFLKSLKTCVHVVGVFWVFQGILAFSIVRNLSREPDFSAENRIFKNFSKSLKTCLAGVFWVFPGILALFDIWPENRIFQPRIGFSKVS